MSTRERLFRGQTADERKAQRRAQLLAAALELIGEDGWNAATMTAICRRAGLTERYFYESFEDRGALYLELLSSIEAEVREAILEALEQGPDDRIRAVAAAIVSVLVTDPRKGRAALLEGWGEERLARSRRASFDAFEELMLNHAEEFGIPDEQAKVLATAAIGMTGELVLRYLEGRLDLDEAGLTDAIARLGLRLLHE